MNHEIIYTESMYKSIYETEKEMHSEKQCLICKVIGTEKIHKFYYEKNEIKRFYNCCSSCRKKLAIEFLEKEITKNYEHFLNYGIDDFNNYYYNLSHNYIIDRFERVTKVLHETYEYENDNSYILK
jgi:hypothetical protein